MSAADAVVVGGGVVGSAVAWFLAREGLDVTLLERHDVASEASGAAAIILHMDTPGGRVDTTEEIVETIFDSPVPIHTFVQQNAISAGSIIACATKTIWMRPGSKIGDAMPVIMSPEGGYKDQAPPEREKIEISRFSTRERPAKISGVCGPSTYLCETPASIG